MEQKEKEYHEGNLLEQALESATATENPNPEVDISNPPDDRPIPVYYASPKQFARMLGVKENTIRQRIQRGTLKTVKIGTKQRIPVTELDIQRTPALRTGNKTRKLITISQDLVDILYIPKVNASATLEAGGWIMAFALGLCDSKELTSAISSIYNERARSLLTIINKGLTELLTEAGE